MGEQHVQYFFSQIDWSARERNKFNLLETFADRFPVDGLRFDYRRLSQAARADFSLCMQIYWNELLDRVHFTSVISLLRAKAWFDGMLSGVREENFHAFAACMRGLIESIGDSCYSLSGVPTRLRDKRSLITGALIGQVDIENYDHYLDEELESRLIHFSHARKTHSGESVPDPAKHHAKHVRTYLDIFKDGPAASLIPVYEELCEISHPASSSNLSFTLIHKDEEDRSIYEVRKDLSFANLISFSKRHRSIFPILVEYSVDPPHECLKILELVRPPRVSN